MIDDPRKARDVLLLDAIDRFKREAFSQSVWRVTREGRDPLIGGRSPSRWCNGSFDVLYTSLTRDGAIAEIYALLSSQPVFPSKIRFFVHQISIRSQAILRLADLAILEKLGVAAGRYRERDYGRTQEISDAAYFLGFSGLNVPNARRDCHNLILFATDRVNPEDIQVKTSEDQPVDWDAWKKTRR